MMSMLIQPASYCNWKSRTKWKFFKNNLTLGRPWEVIQLIATAWMLRLLINILGRTCGHFSFPLTSRIVAESVCTPWLWRCLPDAGRSHSDLTFTPTGLLSVIFHVFPSLLIFSSCVSFLASCVEHCYLLCCLQEASSIFGKVLQLKLCKCRWISKIYTTFCSKVQQSQVVIGDCMSDLCNKELTY